MYQCIVCGKGVRRNSKALSCDSCERWCHIKCGINITLQEYKLLTEGDIDFPWICIPCQLPDLQTDQSISSDDPTMPIYESSRVSSPTPSDAMNWMGDEQRLADFNDATFVIPPPDDSATFVIPPPDDSATFDIPPSDDSATRDIPPSDDSATDELGNQSLFARDLGSFHQPDALLEQSILNEPPVSNHITEDRVVTYRKIESSTNRGKARLLDSFGFSYTLKPVKRDNVDYWRCVVRNKSTNCRATVVQRGDSYKRGPISHICFAEPGKEKVASVIKTTKQQATSRLFDSAAEIVEEVLLDQLDANVKCPTMPKPSALARRANRARQKLRPQDPSDLLFELNIEYIPEDFFQKDIVMEGRRHIVFCSPKMLDLLKMAQTWYVDATFKVVKRPFTQLFSVHAFVRSGSCTKQVPMLFCLMSGKRKQDYASVLRSLVEMLPAPLNVRRVVADFEAAIWEAFRSVPEFRNVEMKGCLFHFTQAVWRKIQDLGMRVDYIHDTGTHKLCRLLMALPLLPQEHVSAVFDAIRPAEMSEPMSKLFRYFDSTWIRGQWHPRDWAVFNMAVRTNNDVEGWHARLNHRGRRGDLPFYVLVDLLAKEAKLIHIQANLVLEQKLTKNQRKRSTLLTARLFALWEEYENNTRSGRSLIESGSNLDWDRFRLGPI